MTIDDDVRNLMLDFQFAHEIKANLETTTFFNELNAILSRIGYTQLTVDNPPPNQTAYYQENKSASASNKLLIVNRDPAIDKIFEFYIPLNEKEAKQLFNPQNPNIDNYQIPAVLSNIIIYSVGFGIVGVMIGLPYGLIIGAIGGIGMSSSEFNNPQPHNTDLSNLFHPGHYLGKIIYEREERNVNELRRRKAAVKNDYDCLINALDPHAIQ